MTFQASDLKGRYFLKLVDSDNDILEPLYSKGNMLWQPLITMTNNITSE